MEIGDRYEYLPGVWGTVAWVWNDREHFDIQLDDGVTVGRLRII